MTWETIIGVSGYALAVAHGWLLMLLILTSISGTEKNPKRFSGNRLTLGSASAKVLAERNQNPSTGQKNVKQSLTNPGIGR